MITKRAHEYGIAIDDAGELLVAEASDGLDGALRLFDAIAASSRDGGQLLLTAYPDPEHTSGLIIKRHSWARDG